MNAVLDKTWMECHVWAVQFRKISSLDHSSYMKLLATKSPKSVSMDNLTDREGFLPVALLEFTPVRWHAYCILQIPNAQNHKENLESHDRSRQLLLTYFTTSRRRATSQTRLPRVSSCTVRERPHAEAGREWPGLMQLWIIQGVGRSSNSALGVTGCWGNARSGLGMWFCCIKRKTQCLDYILNCWAICDVILVAYCISTRKTCGDTFLCSVYRRVTD